MRAAPAVLFALAASSLSGGCAAVAVAGAVGGVAFVAKDRTLGEGVDETTGGAQVRAKLLAADFGAYSQISVEMALGRLLLAGFVPTENHRVEAERIALTTPAVRKVENNLEVGPRPDLWRTSWDAWIATEIRTRFLAEDDVKGVNFTVEVQRGVVYLLGLSRSETELQTAVEIARRINGVEKVVSYIEVRAPTPQEAQTPTPARYKPEPMQTPSAPPDLTAPVAGPGSSSQAVGRRIEVRYPDEDRWRVVQAPAPASNTAASTGANTAAAAGGAENPNGLRGFGRAWATPREAGVANDAAAAASPAPRE